MRILAVGLLAGLGAVGCNHAQGGPDSISAVEKAPVGRYQNAGKREYINGTEVYMVDSQTAQVCYAFIGKDGTDSNSCTAPP